MKYFLCTITVAVVMSAVPGLAEIEDLNGLAAETVKVSGDYVGMTKCDIKYPDLAEINENPGYVLVRYTQESKLRVSGIEILESEPDGLYDRYVIAYLEKCNLTNYRTYPVTGIRQKFHF